MQKKKIYSIDRYETRALNKKSFGERLEEYLKALAGLEAALKKDPLEDDLAVDAAIHRFELVFELNYRLLRAYLECQEVEVSSPRETLRKGAELRIISDADKWIEMMEARNITSHIYDDTEEIKIYQKIKDEYLEMLKSFSERIKKI